MRITHNSTSFITVEKNSDMFHLLILVLSSVVVVYLLPSIINKLFFIALLPFIWVSKKDYFWIGYSFTLITTPGNLFSTNFIANATPVYNIISGISISFFDIFSIMIFRKALNKSNTGIKLLFPRMLLIILFYFILRLIISNFEGQNLNFLIPYVRILLAMTLFYSISILMTSIEDYTNLLNILFPSIVFVVISQLYQLFTGTHFVSLLGSISFVDRSGTIERLANLTPELLLLFLFLATSIIFIINKPIYFIGIVLVFFSFFISATRTWIISLIFLILYFFVNYLAKYRKHLFSPLYILVVLLVFVGIAQNERLQENLTNSYTRTLSSKLLFSDNADDASIIARRMRNLEVRKLLIENPIFGVGYNKAFNSLEGGFTGDPHTGYLNQIANSGIIGFLLTLTLFILVIAKLFRKSVLYSKSLIKHSYSTLIISFFVLVLVNFLSYQTLGFTLRLNQYFFLAIIYNYASLLVSLPRQQFSTNFNLSNPDIFYRQIGKTNGR
jgi:O-antigen ligase